MYNIEYNKEKNLKKGIFCNIKSISIDVLDIDMMKNIELLPNGDKNLVNLYHKYLKSKNKDNITRFTILNNSPNNEKVIGSIILCDWLVNEGSIDLNKEEYLRRKGLFKKIIDEIKDTKDITNQYRCLIMQYYIDTINKVYEKDKIKVLSKN